MADRAAIQRIAKILARATSAEAGEAATALQGAYKRMVRDGVTLEDLLTLPVKDLYQDTLVRLVDVILDQADLSPPARRQAYSQYLLLIAAKFAPSGSGSASRKSREDEAREYEERRRQEEASRGRAEAPGSEPPKDTGFSRQNGNAYNRQNAKTESHFHSVKIRIGDFFFSPAAFFSALAAGLRPVFGAGSLLSRSLHSPGRALRILAASLLWGMGFAGTLLFLAGLVHAIFGMAPLIDFRLERVFSLLTAFGTLWKARWFVHAGWI